MENPLKQIALQKLAAPPSKQSLLDLLSWLDLECATASAETFQKQLLTRSIVAAGYELATKQAFPAIHPVRKTLEAAELYCLEPTEEHFDRYFEAASASYPFGSGEGCYAIADLGYSGCEPGSGCMSGAGSLYSLATELGAEVVGQLIAQELILWLQGEADPVARRVRSR